MSISKKEARELLKLYKKQRAEQIKQDQIKKDKELKKQNSFFNKLIQKIKK